MTLALYLTKLYIRYFILVVLIMVGILLITNIFDTLQKFKAFHLSFGLFWQLNIYKIPYLISELTAIIALISCVLFLYHLSSNNELIVIVTSGISIFKLLLVPIITTLVAGIFLLAVVNPIGVHGFNKYELLANKLTKKKSANFIYTQSGMFLYEEYKDGDRIIETKHLDKVKQELNHVVILFFDTANNFDYRIDASKAIFKNKQIELYDGAITSYDKTQKFTVYNIPTNLTIDHFINSLTAPEMISIWNLGNIIEQFTSFGIPVNNYIAYYYKQLFKPLLMVGMLLLASCFINFNYRQNWQISSMLKALICGAGAYVVIEIMTKFLIIHNIAIISSTFIPIILLIMIVSLILVVLYA